MKTLWRHLLRETLATLAMAVVVCGGLLLLGNLLKEILALLVSGHASLAVVGRGIALLIPYVLTFALPMGMLTAALLVFGRLSADQELTAARANGISVVVLALPVVLLSLVFCGLCAAINLDLGPRCRAAYKDLLSRALLDSRRPPLVEGRFITDFPNLVLYAGKVDGPDLEEVLFYEIRDGRKVRDIRAPRARVTLDPENRKLRFTFYDARVLQWVPASAPALTNALPPADGSAPTNAPAPEGEPPPIVPTNAPEPPESGAAEGEGTWHPAFAAELEAESDLPVLGAETRQRRLADLGFRELLAERRKLTSLGITDATPVEVRLHRQVAFSFASFGFTLIGIPLGVRAHRRETSVGVALAIVLVLIYYSFTVLGDALATRPEAFPWILPWVPNFLFIGVGWWLLRRADCAT